jgi:beta-N-acetylhexosaminidase
VFAAAMLVPVAGSTSAAAACTNAGVISGWSVHRLAEQTIVVPVQETAVGDVSPQVAAGAGGVILFGNTAPTNLRSALAALVRKAPGGVPPFIMTDEEGGAVQRMANLVGSMPSARRMGATMTPTQIRSLAKKVGTKMRANGVTMDLAPVLDLDNGDGPNAQDPDGTRSFSVHVHKATADGLAFARGLKDAGVVPVVKHFPGLGGATANTDLAPADTKPWSVLQNGGLLPFKSAIRDGMPAVMVANAKVPGLTRRPASISRAVIPRVLRNQLGYDGLVLTDSLSAFAVRDAGFHVPAAAVQALRADADMVLFTPTSSTGPHLTRRTVTAIVNAEAAGTLSRSRLEHAALHVVDAKHLNLCS